MICHSRSTASVLLLATAIVLLSIAPALNPFSASANPQAGAQVAGASPPGALVTLPLTRLIDTRAGTGVAQAPIPGSGTLAVQVGGRAGVPDQGVAAVALSVTAVKPSVSGWLVGYADGTARPSVASLNWVGGRSAVGTVVVALASSGKVRLFNGARQGLDVVVDVEGYYVSGSVTAAGGYVPLPPSRSLDTRTGIGATRAAWTDGGLNPSRVLSWQVAGRNGVPAAGVTGVLMSITATNATHGGELSAFEDQAANPAQEFNGTWTLPIFGMPFDAGVPVTNLFIVALSSAGRAKVSNLGANGEVAEIDVMADVVGYVKSGGTTGSGLFQALPPAGVGGVSVPANSTRTIHLAASPGSTMALEVQARGAGWGTVTLFSSGTARPSSSQVSYGPNRVGSGLVFVKLSAQSTLDIINRSPVPAQVDLDAYGYYRAHPIGAGAAWSWGNNPSGELGHSSRSVGSSVPAPIESLTGVVAVASGGNFGFAVKADGSLWAWGKNSNDDDLFTGGNLGDGSGVDRSAPVRVKNLTGVTTALASYEEGAALQSDGTVWTWGASTTGPSGDPSNPVTAREPVRVRGISSVVSLSFGLSGFAAVRADGTVWTWPRRPGGTPSQVAGVSGIKAVSGSNLLRQDGRVQLGTTIRPGLSHIVALSGSWAVRDDGTLWTLDGVRVSGPTHVISVGTSTALGQDRTLWQLNGSAATRLNLNLPRLKSAPVGGSDLSLAITA